MSFCPASFQSKTKDKLTSHKNTKRKWRHPKTFHDLIEQWQWPSFCGVFMRWRGAATKSTLCPCPGRVLLLCGCMMVHVCIYEGWSEHICENVLVAKVARINAYKMLHHGCISCYVSRFVPCLILKTYRKNTYHFLCFPMCPFCCVALALWWSMQLHSGIAKMIKVLHEGLEHFQGM